MMVAKLLLLFWMVFGVCYGGPSSVHLSLFNDENTNALRVVVSFVTDEKTLGMVRYGMQASSLSNNVTEQQAPLYYDTNGGWNHHIALPLLPDRTSVYYVVGSDDEGWTEVFSFTSPRAFPDSFTASVAADFGYDNALGTIREMNARAHSLDFHVCMGDISYANDHPQHYETWWRQWWQALQPFTTSTPFMASPGNHEVSCRCLEYPQTRDFRVFKTKFSYAGQYVAHQRRGSPDGMWYSFDYGPVHFVSFSSESDYPGSPVDVKKKKKKTEKTTTNGFSSFSSFSQQPMSQLEWIQWDLSRVNRSNTPFVIVYAHRPIYVNDPALSDVDGTPKGQSLHMQQAFEEVFHNASVDVMLAGHIHMYQRMERAYQGKVNVTSGMATIMAGGAGSIEGLSHFQRRQVPWFLFGYNTTEGYGILNANRTHLSWQYYSSPENAKSQLIDTAVYKARF